MNNPSFRDRRCTAVLLVLALAAGCSAQRPGNSGSYDPIQGQRSAASKSAKPAGQENSFTATQAHTIQDPTYGVPFGELLLPHGWLFNGGVIHSNTCAVAGPSPVFAGQSPDGKFGLIVMPHLLSQAVNDRQTMAQMQRSGCMPTAASNAAEFARSAVLPRLGLQDVQVVSVTENMFLQPQVRALRQQQQQFESMFGNDRFHRKQTTIDASDVRVSFQANGRAMEGMVSALTQCTHTQTMIPGNFKPLDSRDCQANTLGFVYAPAGELNKMLDNKVVNVKQNPEWLARNQRMLDQQTQEINAAGQQMLAQTQHDNQVRQNQIFSNWQQSSAAQQAQYDQHNQAMRAQSAATHESAQAFAGHMGDYNDYTDAATGKTYRASNQYSDTYINTNGSVMLQTNQAGSPGVDWSLMIPRFR